MAATTSNPSRSRASAAALGLTAIAAVFTYSSLFTTDLCPLFRDVVVFFVPLKGYLGTSLLEGRLPLWNPYIFLGQPFLAELQTGVFYPPSLLLLAGMPVGLNLFLVFHYALGLGGIVRFLAARDLGPASIAIGALTFVIGGFLVSLMNVMNFLQSVVWAPWILLVWSRSLEQPTGGRFAVFVVLLGLQALAGGVEVQLLTIALVVMETIRRPRSRWIAVARLTAAGALAGAVAAFQLLPTAELVHESTRGEAFTLEEVTHFSLEPASLVQLFLPQSSALMVPAEQGGMSVGIESGRRWLGTIYFGLIPFVCALTGAAAGRERIWWPSVAVVGFLLALGSHTPVFGSLYAMAPAIVGKFRYPEKCFFLAHFALTLLAAEGADRMLVGERSARRVFAIAATTLLVVLALVCATRWLYPLEFITAIRILTADPEVTIERAIWLATDIFFKSMRASVILATVLVGFLFWRASLIRKSIFSCLLVGVVAADLGSAHRNFNLSIEWSRLDGPEVVDVNAIRSAHTRILSYSIVNDPESGSPHLDDLPASFPATNEMAEWIALAWRRMLVNASMPREIPSAFGGAGIVRNDTALLHRALVLLPVPKSIDLLAAYSVQVLLGVDELTAPRLQPTATDREDGIRAYEVANPAPRTYLAAKLYAGASGVEAFNRIISPDFRIGKEAVVEALPPGWVDAAPEDVVGSAEIESYEAERVVIRARAERPALLVLNDTFYPGWVARVDDVPTEIVRTNQVVRGVFVESGDHRVEFSYEPMSFRIGLAISLVAWIVLAAIAVIAWRSRKPAGP